MQYLIIPQIAQAKIQTILLLTDWLFQPWKFCFSGFSFKAIVVLTCFGKSRIVQINPAIKDHS